MSLSKKIGLVGGAIAISLVGAVFSIGLPTLGSYVVDELFPQRFDRGYEINLILLVHVGTNFLFYFAILVGLYVWRAKAADRRKNVPK